MTQAVAENRSPRYIRTISFTVPAADVAIGDGSFLAKNFSLQIVPVGAITSWTVLLEGSLDNINFDTILSHSDTSPGSGKIRFDGGVSSPCVYFRINCTALVLGAGTSIKAMAIGI